MISTSRFFTCDSSCAITPSSSAGDSVRIIPVVAQTVAFFWERPIANALGTSVSATAIFGFGKVRLDAEPFDHRVQARRLLGRDLLGAHGAQRQLVREEQLGEGLAPRSRRAP